MTTGGCEMHRSTLPHSQHDVRVRNYVSTDLWSHNFGQCWGSVEIKTCCIFVDRWVRRLRFDSAEQVVWCVVDQISVYVFSSQTWNRFLTVHPSLISDCQHNLPSRLRRDWAVRIMVLLTLRCSVMRTYSKIIVGIQNRKMLSRFMMRCLFI